MEHRYVIVYMELQTLKQYTLWPTLFIADDVNDDVHALSNPFSLHLALCSKHRGFRSRYSIYITRQTFGLTRYCEEPWGSPKDRSRLRDCLEFLQKGGVTSTWWAVIIHMRWVYSVQRLYLHYTVYIARRRERHRDHTCSDWSLLLLCLIRCSAVALL